MKFKVNPTSLNCDEHSAIFQRGSEGMEPTQNSRVIKSHELEL